jgi:hypothetical protein
MLVTLVPMVTLVIAAQSSKALAPIPVTLLGMVALVRWVQP